MTSPDLKIWPALRRFRDRMIERPNSSYTLQMSNEEACELLHIISHHQGPMPEADGLHPYISLQSKTTAGGPPDGHKRPTAGETPDGIPGRRQGAERPADTGRLKEAGTA